MYIPYNILDQDPKNTGFWRIKLLQLDNLKYIYITGSRKLLNTGNFVSVPVSAFIWSDYIPQ